MSVKFYYGMGDTTKLYYKKLIAAKTNEIISGGDKSYAGLAEKFNTGKVGKFVHENPDSFDKEVGSFVSKKQARLEKKLQIEPTETDASKRLFAFQRHSVYTDMDSKKLENIYKYFAEKARPEIYY